jgi:hypothetical protein
MVKPASVAITPTTSKIQYSVTGAALGSGIVPASGVGADVLTYTSVAAITNAKAGPPHLSTGMSQFGKFGMASSLGGIRFKNYSTE